MALAASAAFAKALMAFPLATMFAVLPKVLPMLLSECDGVVGKGAVPFLIISRSSRRAAIRFSYLQPIRHAQNENRLEAKQSEASSEGRRPPHRS